MNDVLLSCDCDCVIEMEDMAVGVQEMLQYAHAVLSRREVRGLMEGLECTFCEGGSEPGALRLVTTNRRPECLAIAT